ncbi:hypothetical protein ACFQ07_09090, partial [Actinomadura adrarensis]
SPAPQEPPAEQPATPLSKAQQSKLFALLNSIGLKDRPEQLRVLAVLTARELSSRGELTADDAHVIDTLDTISRSTDPRGLLTAYLVAASNGDQAEKARLLSTAGNTDGGGA